jgi:hypothetical protein
MIYSVDPSVISSKFVGGQALSCFIGLFQNTYRQTVTINEGG